MDDNIKETAKLLKECESIFFVTGAGISADSGLPTYRGVGGLYNGKTTEDGIPIETALAGETIRNKPAITWKYLYKIEQKCRDATFNKGHEIIAKIEKSFKRVWILTQNIDGFHHQAGAENVIEIHGNMHNLVCPYCSWDKRVEHYGNLKVPPKCPKCKKIIRPDVVFFGEMLSQEKLQLLRLELSKGFDLYFSVGTTSTFPYIQAPIIQASQQNKHTIEINPSSTEISHIVDIKINMGAAEALEKIWKSYRNSL